MSHNCKNLVINCMDFRLPVDTFSFLQKAGLLDDCDYVSVPGSVRALTVTPVNSLFSWGGIKERILFRLYRLFMMYMLWVSVHLHHIQEVVAINHNDCGAYSGKKFDSLDEEYRFHIQELRKAKKIILNKYPYLKVRMMLAKLEVSSGRVKDFEEVSA
jgi:hypothetical protein